MYNGVFFTDLWFVVEHPVQTHLAIAYLFYLYILFGAVFLVKTLLNHWQRWWETIISNKHYDQATTDLVNIMMAYSRSRFIVWKCLEITRSISGRPLIPHEKQNIWLYIYISTDNCFLKNEYKNIILLAKYGKLTVTGGRKQRYPFSQESILFRKNPFDQVSKVEIVCSSVNTSIASVSERYLLYAAE